MGVTTQLSSLVIARILPMNGGGLMTPPLNDSFVAWRALAGETGQSTGS